jgi:hypothetical protein
MNEQKVAPNWIVEYLVTNLYRDLEQGKYISAVVQARAILDMARSGTSLPPQVIQLSEKAIIVLNSKGYSEEQYLMSLNAHAEKFSCPPDSIPVKKDGTCEDGYLPIFDTNNKKAKCCQKMKQRFQKMDQDNEELLKQLTKDNAPVDIRAAFVERFGLNRDSEVAREKANMLSANIPEHSQKFVEVTTKEEAERLNLILPEAMQKGTGHELVGMSQGLFQYLMNMFGDVKNFIKWYVQHDWSYWWLAIYLFRFLSLFICMWISVQNAKEMMDKMAESMFGFKPLTFFLAASWGPLILVPVLFSSLMTLMSNQNLVSTIFSGLSAALGSFMTIGFLHMRVMNLLTSVGFTYDLTVLATDIFQTAYQFLEKTGKLLWEGKGVVGSITSAAHESTSLFCKTQLDLFFSQALKIVQQITVNLFYVFCVIIMTIISGGTGYLTAQKGCAYLQAAINKFLESFQVAISIQGLLQGDWFQSFTAGLKKNFRIFGVQASDWKSGQWRAPENLAFSSAASEFYAAAGAKKFTTPIDTKLEFWSPDNK